MTGPELPLLANDSKSPSTEGHDTHIGSKSFTVVKCSIAAAFLKRSVKLLF
jgi:hypothetical protein